MLALYLSAGGSSFLHDIGNAEAVYILLQICRELVSQIFGLPSDIGRGWRGSPPCAKFTLYLNTKSSNHMEMDCTPRVMVFFPEKINCHFIFDQFKDPSQISMVSSLPPPGMAKDQTFPFFYPSPYQGSIDFNTANTNGVLEMYFLIHPCG